MTSSGRRARKRNKKILLIVAETLNGKKMSLRFTYMGEKKVYREMFLKVFPMNSAIICNITIHEQKSIIYMWTSTFATRRRGMMKLCTLTAATQQTSLVGRWGKFLFQNCRLCLYLHNLVFWVILIHYYYYYYCVGTDKNKHILIRKFEGNIPHGKCRSICKPNVKINIPSKILISRLWHTSTPTRFGTEFPSSGSHYNKGI